MTQNNPITDTELAKGITITNYRDMEKNQDREEIAKMILQRFQERYITPLRGDPDKKHGFSLMAISCLMIEALNTFQEGWEHSDGKSRDSFKDFFNNNPEFAVFIPYHYSFFKHVRCAILHQAETTNGWRILRSGPLFDTATRTINAKKFHDTLEDCLIRYCNQLKIEDWNSDLWKKCRIKLEAIVKNCTPLP